MTDREDERRPGVGWKATLLACALLFGVGVGTVHTIFSTEPTTAREGATRKNAMGVDVVVVERGTHRPEFVATGEVEAEADIVLSPRVAGQVVWRSPHLEPGRFVEEGEPLLRIDPADFRVALAQRQSELRQAASALEVEKGRREVAQAEVEMFDGEMTAATRARASRKPQLEAARGAVRSAKAAVHQAQLDLRRTEVKAPFAGQVLSRAVDRGSQVAVGAALGRLVGVERYRVIVTLPRPTLRWLPVGEEGAEVRVRNRGAWAPGQHRQGRLEAVIGALDTETRLARLVATVPDPLARAEGASPDMPVLMIGDFVEVRAVGAPIDDVVKLERRLLRKDDTVWVYADGELAIRDVQIVVGDATHVYVREGLQTGDRVVTTQLAAVREGAPLRLRGSTDAGGEGDG